MFKTAVAWMLHEWALICLVFLTEKEYGRNPPETLRNRAKTSLDRGQRSMSSALASPPVLAVIWVNLGQSGDASCSGRAADSPERHAILDDDLCLISKDSHGVAEPSKPRMQAIEGGPK
jgi:hypothetical protein